MSESPKSGHSVETILQAAREILALEGYSSFTIRNIAKQAGVSIGNVQYHFQSKDVLLQELILYATERHEREYCHMCSKTPDAPDTKLNAFIDFMLSGATEPLRRGFFFQSWALALNNELIEKRMEQSMIFFRSAVSELIADLMPPLDKVEREKRAAAILSLLEGAQLALIKKEKRFAHRPGMAALIKSEIHDIATEMPR